MANFLSDDPDAMGEIGRCSSEVQLPALVGTADNGCSSRRSSQQVQSSASDRRGELGANFPQVQLLGLLTQRIPEQSDLQRMIDIDRFIRESQNFRLGDSRTEVTGFHPNFNRQNPNSNNSRAPLHYQAREHGSIGGPYVFSSENHRLNPIKQGEIGVTSPQVQWSASDRRDELGANFPQVQLPALFTQRIPEQSALQRGIDIDRLIHEVQSFHLGDSRPRVTGFHPSNNDPTITALPQFPSENLYYHTRECGSIGGPYVLSSKIHNLKPINPCTFDGNYVEPSNLQSNPYLHYNLPANLGRNQSLSTWNPSYGAPVSRNIARGLHYDNLAVSPFLGSSSTNGTAGSTIINFAFDIMKGEFGRITFEMFLDDCDDRQKEAIVYRVTQDRNKLVEVVKHEIGFESFKKLIKAVKTSPQLCHSLLLALSHRMLEVMTHSNGPRMVQWCIKQLEPTQNSILFLAAFKNFDRLVRDQSGSRSLKRCVKHSTAPYRIPLLMKVAENPFELARDRYGNYVLQCAIRIDDPHVTNKICNDLSEHYAELSMSKIGSHVMERCLQSSAGGLLLQILVTNTELLEEIATNEYGNYVIQTALKAEKDMQLHDKLLCAIDKLSNLLNYHPNSRNVVKVCKKLQKRRGRD